MIKHIAIDGNEANVKNRVGSNEYAFQMLQHLKRVQSSRLRQACLPVRQGFGGQAKFKIYLKDEPLKDLPKETSWWQYKILKPKFLWTQWRLPLELYLAKEKPDVFFTPGHYGPRFCPVPFVISIMDLAFLRFPEQFNKDDLYQLVNWTKYSVKKASHILTISEFTKKEIIHFYHIPEEKITVTYPGIDKLKVNPPTGGEKFPAKRDPDQANACREKLKYNLQNQYFIYIGTLQPRKNLIKLIEAFALLITNHQSPITKLVIAGKKGWLYEGIFNKVKELGLENKVIFTGYVSEKEKHVLLQNALAFVLPSLYEGFGIPVLEAMQLGCPVVISNVSSLPEVAGQAGIYIDDPNSSLSIYQALLKMVKLGNREREELIKRGFEQVKKFSWEEAGEKTLCSILKVKQEKN